MSFESGKSAEKISVRYENTSVSANIPGRGENSSELKIAPEKIGAIIFQPTKYPSASPGGAATAKITEAPVTISFLICE